MKYVVITPKASRYQYKIDNKTHFLLDGLCKESQQDLYEYVNLLEKVDPTNNYYLWDVAEHYNKLVIDAIKSQYILYTITEEK